MLQNLRRYFYANKTKVIKYVIIIVLVILIIQGMNSYVGKKAREENNKFVNSEFSYGNLITFSNTVNANNSIVTNQIQNQIGSNNTIQNNITSGGNSISNNIQIGGGIENGKEDTQETVKNEKEETIKSYLDLCMQGNSEQAYEMLTEDCKKVLFPTIEQFKKNYISSMFKNNQTYVLENYMGYTYKVRLMQDMSSTGIYTPLANTDYITVDIIDGQYKLNVNNYIGRELINKHSTNSDITVKVNYKDIFMDYEKYNITITNGTKKTIKLIGSNGKDGMYVTDTKGNQYYAKTHELNESSLILRSGSTTDFNIKYISTYSEYTISKNKVVFTDIILDYENYRKLENKDDYEDISSIEVQI